MTRRNQKYIVVITWDEKQKVKKFQVPFRVSSMAVAANRALRDWRKSHELNKARPAQIIMDIRRIETPTKERGSGKRIKLTR